MKRRGVEEEKEKEEEAVCSHLNPWYIMCKGFHT